MAGTVLQAGETNLRRIVQAVNDAMAGRSNAVGSVTLAANETSTTVAAVNCGPDSRVFLMSASADAATELAAGGLYIDSVGAGSFVIAHANDPSSDRTFFWVALG